jgi:hypothetical protein
VQTLILANVDIADAERALDVSMTQLYVAALLYRVVDQAASDISRAAAWIRYRGLKEHCKQLANKQNIRNSREHA